MYNIYKTSLFLLKMGNGQFSKNLGNESRNFTYVISIYIYILEKVMGKIKCDEDEK